MFAFTLWQLWDDNLYKHTSSTKKNQEGEKAGIFFFCFIKNPLGPQTKVGLRAKAMRGEPPLLVHRSAAHTLLCQNFKVQICKKITIEKTPGSKKPKVHFLFFNRACWQFTMKLRRCGKSLEDDKKKSNQIRFQTTKVLTHGSPSSRMSTTNAARRRRIFSTSPFLRLKRNWMWSKILVHRRRGRDPIPSARYPRRRPILRNSRRCVGREVGKRGGCNFGSGVHKFVPIFLISELILI